MSIPFFYFLFFISRDFPFGISPPLPLACLSSCIKGKRDMIKKIEQKNKKTGQANFLGLKLKHKHTFRENILWPLLKSNLLKMTIPDKPNSRLQKYVAVKSNQDSWVGYELLWKQMEINHSGHPTRYPTSCWEWKVVWPLISLLRCRTREKECHRIGHLFWIFLTNG